MRLGIVEDRLGVALDDLCPDWLAGTGVAWTRIGRLTYTAGEEGGGDGGGGEPAPPTQRTPGGKADASGLNGVCEGAAG